METAIEGTVHEITYRGLVPALYSHSRSTHSTPKWAIRFAVLAIGSNRVLAPPISRLNIRSLGNAAGRTKRITVEEWGTNLPVITNGTVEFKVSPSSTPGLSNGEQYNTT
jgi:hypothetical protein